MNPKQGFLLCSSTVVGSGVKLCLALGTFSELCTESLPSLTVAVLVEIIGLIVRIRNSL